MQIYPALVPSERVSIRHRLLIHIERRRRMETSNYSETGKRELFYKCNQIAKTLVFMYRFFSASRICSMILTRKVQRSRMHICFSERTRWNMSGVYANKLREIGLFRWESNWQKGRRRVMQCILLTTMYIRYLYLAFITDSSIFKLYGVFLFYPFFLRFHDLQIQVATTYHPPAWFNKHIRDHVPDSEMTRLPLYVWFCG